MLVGNGRLPVFAQSGKEVLIKNATVLTASHGTLANTDILIQNGKIAKIGKGLTAGAGAQIFDATGEFVSPGIIDCHSHLMLDAINEGTLSVTSMTRIRDVLNTTDVGIYRALAGGTTAANLLHGSANSIGGQNAVVKFKWGKPVEDFVIKDAPPGIKFAMGENPRGTNNQGAGLPGGRPQRYPHTRQGVIETDRDALMAARDYKKQWDDYRARVAKGNKTAIPPRRNIQLEPLVEVLEGKRLIHAHGYRSDEHLNLMLLADEFGFRVGTLQHTLEGYKIAPEIAKHGTGASIFADYGQYKLEAFDTIPYNAYIMWKAGVVVSINSDDDGRIRRLNTEAAKVIKYGPVPEEEALKMITLNPAKQLGIDKRTGSIDVGKDADLVIWSGHPFSIYSHPETTMIEGEVYFDRAKDIAGRAALAKERDDLEKLDVNRAPGTGGGPPRIPTEHRVTDKDKGFGDDEIDDSVLHSDGGNH
jgi:imidazolonepropionase-like amidohydrolase